MNNTLPPKHLLKGTKPAVARVFGIETEQDCLNTIQAAYSRLKALGWRDGMYMPKDGTMVTVMQVGSTGTFDCKYSGEWADGFFNVFDGGDVYPARSAPALFKPKSTS